MLTFLIIPQEIHVLIILVIVFVYLFFQCEEIRQLNTWLELHRLQLRRGHTATKKSEVRNVDTLEKNTK